MHVRPRPRWPSLVARRRLRRNPTKPTRSRATPAEAVRRDRRDRVDARRRPRQVPRRRRRGAEETVGDAYLEHFEQVEDPLEEVDQELMEELEDAISTEIRTKIKDGEPAAEVEALVDATKADLDQAEGEAPGLMRRLSSSCCARRGRRLAAPAARRRRRAVRRGAGARSPRRASSSTRPSRRRRRATASGPTTLARKAYLDHFEYAEVPLRLRDPNLVLDLEFAFAEAAERHPRRRADVGSSATTRSRSAPAARRRPHARRQGHRGAVDRVRLLVHDPLPRGARGGAADRDPARLARGGPRERTTGGRSRLGVGRCDRRDRR